MLLGLAVLVVAWSQSDPLGREDSWEELEVSPTPVGEVAYAEALRTAVGAPVALDELAAAAREDADRLERHLDAVAGRIDPEAGDWRPVLDRLKQSVPPTRDAVFEAYRRAIERTRAFVTGRDLVALPAQGVDLFAIENPALRQAFPLAMYREGGLGLTLGDPGTGSADGANRNHCETCIPPLVAHEIYPGHHVAFALTGRDLPRDHPDRRRRDPVYHEGWGLYSEILMLEDGFYGGDPEAELTAWWLILLRVRRAEMDLALHRESLTPGEARAAYRALVLPDASARAEVERHLERPGLKASYYLGLKLLLALRREVVGNDAADPARRAELRAFHDRFLRAQQDLPALARERFRVELQGLGAPLPLSDSGL